MSWGNTRIRGNPQSVQKLLDENAQLIQAIVDYQNKGKAAECVQYQQLLHKNLMYLASLADSTQNIQAMLPPPPTSNHLSSVTAASSSIGAPSSNVPGNLQDRKVQAGTAMDQGSTGMPPQVIISSAGSQMASGVHTSPAPMTTGSADTTSNLPYGGNMNTQTLGGNTTPVTGYSGNINQMMAANMPATSQSIMPGQQQNFMPNMHPTPRMQQQQQQGQQFMMQQGVAMSYNRPPVQMHSSQPGHHQQQMTPAFTVNQVLPGQSAMVGYQPAAPSYDPYNPMQQHINTGYNHPYAPQ